MRPNRPKRDYLDEWFGPHVTFERKRRNSAIAAFGVIILSLSLAYLLSGFYCNTVLWIAFGAFLPWVIIKGRDRFSDDVVAAFIVFIIVPLLIIAVFPWHLHSDEDDAPAFVDYITYWVSGTHVVVDGSVVNEGRVGGIALVQISAWGGDSREPGSWNQTSFSTGWLYPGGSYPVHWECTLSYYGSSGGVDWTIIPVKNL